MQQFGPIIRHNSAFLLGVVSNGVLSCVAAALIQRNTSIPQLAIGAGVFGVAIVLIGGAPLAIAGSKS